MSTTLRNVADHVQVSPALVSRVLNHAPGKWASEDTQARIFAAAAELNYRPSASAKALRTGKTRQLAVVSVDGASGDEQFLDLEGLVLGAGEADYRVVVLPLSGGPEGEKALEEFLANRVCDGICLFAPQVTKNHLRAVQQHEIPCVIIGSLDEKLADLAQEYSAIVDHDNYRAAFSSVRWLHEQGKTRIAWAKVLGEADQWHVRELRRGYCEAMSECGLEPLILEHFEEAAARQFYLEGRVIDAIITRYLHGALHWMMDARSVGLSLPDDLTIMAHLEAHDVKNLVLCGANRFIAVHLYGVREVGYRAAQILLNWASSDPPSERTIWVAPHAPVWGVESEQLKL